MSFVAGSLGFFLFISRVGKGCLREEKVSQKIFLFFDRNFPILKKSVPDKSQEYRPFLIRTAHKIDINYGKMLNYTLTTKEIKYVSTTKMA